MITALLEHSDNFKQSYGHLYKYQKHDHLHPITADVRLGSTATLGVRNPYDRILSLTRWINKIKVYSTYYTVKKHLIEVRRHKKIRWQDRPKGIAHLPYKWTIQATLCDWEDSLPDACTVIPIRFDCFTEDVKTIYPDLPELPHIHHVTDPISFDHVKENFDCQETLDKFNSIYAVDCDRYNYNLIEHINDFYQQYQK